MHDLYFYSTDLIFFSKVGSGLELHAPRLHMVTVVTALLLSVRLPSDGYCRSDY